MLHNAIAGSLYRPLPPVSSVKEIRGDPAKATELKDFSKGDTGKDTEEGVDLVTHPESAGNQGSGDHVEGAPAVSSKSKLNESQRTCVPCQPGSVWRNWTFWLYGYLIISMQTCIMTFLIFLPDFCLELGVDRRTAAWTLTIFGFCDMVGRFLFGFLFDLRSIRQNRRDFFCFVAFMFGASVATMAFMPNFVACCIVTGIIGKCV